MRLLSPALVWRLSSRGRTVLSTTESVSKRSFVIPSVASGISSGRHFQSITSPSALFISVSTTSSETHAHQRRFKSSVPLPSDYYYDHDNDSNTGDDDIDSTLNHIDDDYNVSQTLEGPAACRQAGLDRLGVTSIDKVYRNLSYDELAEHELRNNEGHFVSMEGQQVFAVDTGKFTGRSPKDKYVVQDDDFAKDIDWNHVNQPISSDVYDKLFDRAIRHFNSLSHAYVFDGYCGAGSSQKKVKFLHEMAWQQHFVTNMFRRPESLDEEGDSSDTDFTVINCCSQVVKDWKELGLHSENAILFNLKHKTALIFGTWYGGENKKGIFSLMNYWLPAQKTLSMHCSANVDSRSNSGNNVALFFGLSGTGKTTLSADPNRRLIGDDEHGWDDDGVFNLEGGCYAKTINLRQETEPDIFQAIRPGALLENVALKKHKAPDGSTTLIPDFFDTSKTENGRVSYPIHHIQNYLPKQQARHPNHIIFLSCDAFGILPPVAKLSTKQAMYHFLSGYTAKVAGTELGLSSSQPEATFSACFGAAFLTRTPLEYATLLHEKLLKHDTEVYLVNSGWSGGAAGGAVGGGARMNLDTTRACVTAILEGNLQDSPTRTDETFGFQVPLQVDGVDSNLLNPKNTWTNPFEYEATRVKLAKMYMDNFRKQYSENDATMELAKFGPKVRASAVADE